jgi:hypothetical protein
MRKLQFIALAFGVVSVAWGNACTSAANGNWSSPATWSNCVGTYPGNGDTVTITHQVTVDINTTVGNSPSDVAGAIPTTPVIQLTRTNGTSSNGQLTINSGITFTVKGSVFVQGSGAYAPTITINPGATWTFDNSDTTQNAAVKSAVYRIQSVSYQTASYINAPGTAWTAGNYVTLNGRPPSCSDCAQAMWVNEGTTVAGGKYSSFKQNYSYVKFWYFGSTTDAYRSIHFNCLDNASPTGQQMYMSNVEFHGSTGFASGGSSGYPCSYTDFKVEYLKAVDSVGAANGFWHFSPVGSPQTGKNRIARYIYLDRGFAQLGGTMNTFQGFQTVSYIVADGQRINFGPTGTYSSALYPTTVDHILVRQAVNFNNASMYGLTNSYWLWVADGGVGNTHSLQTPMPNSGPVTITVDHHIWQDGEGTSSADTDATEAWATSLAGMAISFNYMMMLPSAANSLFTNHTVNVDVGSVPTNVTYNHLMFTFGTNAQASTNPLQGSLYYGEQSAGHIGSVVALKNSILWSPNSTASLSPVGVGSSRAYNTVVANTFDPAGIHNNAVWNYSTNANRWTTANYPATCPTVNCTSYGTPYDVPTTGTIPGANDVHVDPQFVWQKQGITAPGPRDWAHIKHGADITTGESSSEAHFATTFAIFAAADPADTTTAAGLKGLIDDMFTWLYAEWASTNPALKAAADDGSDIGAAPVAIRCPTAYPAGDLSGCNGLAQAGRPADLGGSAHFAGSN